MIVESWKSSTGRVKNWGVVISPTVSKRFSKVKTGFMDLEEMMSFL